MIGVLTELWEEVYAFVERGGPVLVAILFAMVLMWTAIFERTAFLGWVQPAQAQQIRARWRARSDHRSWYAERIRRLWLSRAGLEIERSLVLLKALVAVCPLLGLLGTVTGMIEVFDVMAIAGNGNPRAMAAGVSRATIPTMAGMVAALSGYVFSTQLSRWAAKRRAQLELSLDLQAGKQHGTETSAI